MAATPDDDPDRTVFLVDGDASLRDRLVSLLQRAGYQTCAFDRGEALLDLADERLQSGCVITEIMLPGLSGLALARALRARAIAIPVIILTGDADVATAVHAMRNDVADFLLKPVIERVLLRRLARALRRHTG